RVFQWTIRKIYRHRHHLARLEIHANELAAVRIQTQGGRRPTGLVIRRLGFRQESLRKKASDVTARRRWGNLKFPGKRYARNPRARSHLLEDLRLEAGHLFDAQFHAGAVRRNKLGGLFTMTKTPVLGPARGCTRSLFSHHCYFDKKITHQS